MYQTKTVSKGNTQYELLKSGDVVEWCDDKVVKVHINAKERIESEQGFNFEKDGVLTC